MEHKEKKQRGVVSRVFGGDLCRLAVLLALAGLFPHAVEALTGLAHALQGTAHAEASK